MNLTVYSDDFETDSVGFNGNIFVEDGRNGLGFTEKVGNLSRALKYISDENVSIKEILFNYRVGGDQMFRRFMVIGS